MSFSDTKTLTLTIDPAANGGAVTATYSFNERLNQISYITLRALTTDGIQGVYPDMIGLRLRTDSNRSVESASLQTSLNHSYTFVIPLPTQDHAEWYGNYAPTVQVNPPIKGTGRFVLDAVVHNPTGGAETTLCAAPATGRLTAYFEVGYDACLN